MRIAATSPMRFWIGAICFSAQSIEALNAAVQDFRDYREHLRRQFDIHG